MQINKIHTSAIFFISFIFSHPVQGASTPESVDVTFNVECESVRHTLVFKNALPKFSSVFGNTFKTHSNHTIRVVANDLKASDVAFHVTSQDNVHSLYAVYDRNGKSSEICIEVAQAYLPLLQSYCTYKINQYDFAKKSFQAQERIRDQIDKKTMGRPSPFCLACIFLRDKQYFRLSSYFDSNGKMNYPEEHDLQIFKDDIISFDFKNGDNADIFSSSSDPLIEHLRGKERYSSYLKLYVIDSSLVQVDMFGENILHKAAQAFDIETAEKLLSLPLFREHINDTSKVGRTALEHACARGCTGIVRLLLTNGADQCIENNDLTLPLHEAIKNYGLEQQHHIRKRENRYELIQVLLGAPGAHAAISHKDKQGHTPIDRARLKSKDYAESSSTHSELLHLIEQMEKMQVSE